MLLKENSKYDVVILVGGKGSRIKKFSKNMPKPLIKVSGHSFVDYIINHLKKFNINKIYLLAGYKSFFFKKKYNNKFKNLIPIKVICEDKPLGTAGGLKKIQNLLTKNFFVINGDSFFDVNLHKIYEMRQKNKFVLGITKNDTYKSNSQLSNLKINKQKIIKFSKKGNLMNAGIYLLNKSIFKYIDKGYSSLEKITENLIKKNKIIGFYSKSFFIDIGIPKNLIFAKKKLKKYLTKPAIFLDRDGTIIRDNGYVHKLKDLSFKFDALKLIRKYIRKNYYIFIVTNQAGIAKKKFTLNQFILFQNFLKYELIKKKIFIDDLRYCPYHEKSLIKKFKKKSSFRKPGNLMIKSLIKEWSINLSKSLMIGNSDSDKKCALKSNIKYYDISEIKINKL